MALWARCLPVAWALIATISWNEAVAMLDDAGGQVPVTILGPPRDPQPTAVMMMPTGMKLDPVYLKPPAYAVPEAAAAGTGGSLISQEPAVTVADAPEDMHKSSLPLSYHDDDSFGAVTTSADDVIGVGNLYPDQIYLQPQQVVVSQADIPTPAGVASRASTTSSYSSTLPNGATTTTTVTTIVLINRTTSSSSTTGGAVGSLGAGSAGVSIPLPVEMQPPATPVLPAGSPAATTAAGAGLSDSPVASSTVVKGRVAEPLTGPQQPAASSGARATQPMSQVSTVGRPAVNSTQPTMTWSRAETSPKVLGDVGAVGGRRADIASNGSAAGNAAKSAVEVVATVSNGNNSSSNTAVLPKQGLQAAVVTPKPTSAGTNGSGFSASTAPQTRSPVIRAYSNVTAPAPFVFKQKGANKTIMIGCSLPFEGSQKLAGEAVYSGLMLAITDLAPKTVPNLNINLTCFNSRCSDIPTYAAVTKLADDGAIAVIGEICSRATVAAAGVANARKIPVISPASTSPSLSQTDYFFRTVPSDRYQGVAAAGLVYKSGVRNVAVVYEDSAYGFGLSFNFIAGFTKDGANVPVYYSFKMAQGNPNDAVAKVKAGVSKNKLDGVFLATNNLTFVADFLVAAKAANLDNLKYFGGDAIADYTLIQNIGRRSSVLGNLTLTSVAPGSMAFVQKYEKFTNTRTYSPYAARAYDAMDALLRAYKAAAAPKNGTMIIQQLARQTFQGVSDKVAFDQFGDAIPSNQTYVYINWNATAGTPILRGFISMYM